jgi:hypothetical protein
MMLNESLYNLLRGIECSWRDMRLKVGYKKAWNRERQLWNVILQEIVTACLPSRQCEISNRSLWCTSLISFPCRWNVLMIMACVRWRWQGNMDFACGWWTSKWDHKNPTLLRAHWRLCFWWGSLSWLDSKYASLQDFKELMSYELLRWHSLQLCSQMTLAVTFTSYLQKFGVLPKLQF